MHKYSVEKNTKSKMNKSYFCNINDQNRTFIFDAAQESVRCYHNDKKIKIFKQCLQGRSQ